MSSSKALPTDREELAAIVRHLMPSADVSTLRPWRRGKRQTEIKIAVRDRRLIRIDYDDHQRLRGWYAWPSVGRRSGRLDTVGDLTRWVTDCLRLEACDKRNAEVDGAHAWADRPLGFRALVQRF